MAERRMFAKTIIDSDAFLDLPQSTQNLYFHLCMRADDDGFINNPKKIQRMIGSSDDDMKLLIAKKFIIPFDSGVVVIKHWKIHNYIRGDRYKETIYTEEKKLLETKGNKGYRRLDTIGVPVVYQAGDKMDTQVRLGKVRLELGKESSSCNLESINNIQQTITATTVNFEQEAINLWEQNIGTISPILWEKICWLVGDSGIVAFRKAIEKAVSRNKRNFAYIKTVAEGIAAGDDWSDNDGKLAGNSKQDCGKQGLPPIEVMSNSEQSYEQKRVDDYNNILGDLSGYDCLLCKNKGYIAEVGKFDINLVECQCQKIRRSNKQIADSGINKNYSLDTFIAKTDWQEVFLAKAKKYIAEPKGWFYAGGQVGSGKTHICSAIFNELVKRGNEGHYMLWNDVAGSLKATVNDIQAHKEVIKPLKSVKILYIDDFLKVKQGDKPTSADITVAFKIINARYNNPELITIISSEHYLGEIRHFDDAVGSRIYEKTQEYCVTINHDKTRNYRMKE